MSFFKRFMVLPFFLALTGCVPSSPVVGEVISSKQVGQGITEHLVKTSSPHIPYYILRVTNNNFHKGSKVVLEFPVDSIAHSSY